MLKMTALAFAFIAGIAGSAFAGEQYVDKTGFAVSGYDVVSYFDLPQSKIGQPQQSPLPGSKAFTAEHNGVTFAFATATRPCGGSWMASCTSISPRTSSGFGKKISPAT